MRLVVFCGAVMLGESARNARVIIVLIFPRSKLIFRTINTTKANHIWYDVCTMCVPVLYNDELEVLLALSIIMSRHNAS